MTAFLTDNDRNFTNVSTPPSNIRQLIWQGLPGVYLAAANGGLYKTVDYGATWGVLRPNTEFGTAWPGGASGYQVSMAIGPRECPEEGVMVADITAAMILTDNGFNPVSSISNDYAEFLFGNEFPYYLWVGTKPDSAVPPGSDLFVGFNNSSIESDSSLQMGIFADAVGNAIFLAVGSVNTGGTSVPNVTDLLGLTWNHVGFKDQGDMRVDLFWALATQDLVDLGSQATATFGGVQDIIMMAMTEYVFAGSDPVIESSTGFKVLGAPTTFNVDFEDPEADHTYTLQGTSTEAAAIAVSLR